MVDSPLGQLLASAAGPGTAFRARHGHAVAGADAPLEHLVIGTGGVFVVRTARAGRVARQAQARDVQRDVRAVRAILDAAGLKAVTATAVLCEPRLDGHPLRAAGGTLRGDMTSVLRHFEADGVYGPATVQAALLALDPPPFIATVKQATPAPGTPVVARPRVAVAV